MGKLVGRVSGNIVGSASGKHLIQNYSQRVDVAGRGDRLAPDLFRAGILWRHQSKKANGLFVLVNDLAGFKYLRDSEIQQLWDSFGVDEDVAGLDVAMNNQPLVCVLH